MPKEIQIQRQELKFRCANRQSQSYMIHKKHNQWLLELNCHGILTLQYLSAKAGVRTVFQLKMCDTIGACIGSMAFLSRLCHKCLACWSSLCSALLCLGGCIVLMGQERVLIWKCPGHKAAFDQPLAQNRHLVCRAHCKRPSPCAHVRPCTTRMSCSTSSWHAWRREGASASRRSLSLKPWQK